MAHLGADLHIGSDIHRTFDDNDLSRDMAASMGFSPSPDRALNKSKPQKIYNIIFI